MNKAASTPVAVAVTVLLLALGCQAVTSTASLGGAGDANDGMYNQLRHRTLLQSSPTPGSSPAPSNWNSTANSTTSNGAASNGTNTGSPPTSSPMPVNTTASGSPNQQQSGQPATGAPVEDMVVPGSTPATPRSGATMNGTLDAATMNGTLAGSNSMLVQHMDATDGVLQQVLPISNLIPADRNLLCQQPAVAGQCRASIPRWFYNSTAQQCELFIYGGCGGNGNSFPSAALCLNTCSGVASANISAVASPSPSPAPVQPKAVTEVVPAPASVVMLPPTPVPAPSPSLKSRAEPAQQASSAGLTAVLAMAGLMLML